MEIGREYNLRDNSGLQSWVGKTITEGLEIKQSVAVIADQILLTIDFWLNTGKNIREQKTAPDKDIK
jgi:hypothetical protein